MTLFFRGTCYQCNSSSGFPDEELNNVAIGVTNIQLLDTIAAWTRTTGDLYPLRAQMLHCLLQVTHLKGYMRCVSNSQFIGLITRIHLPCAPLYILLYQV